MSGPICDDRRRRRFLAQHCTGCSFRIAGDSILLWQERIRPVAELARHTQLLAEFVGLLPADVWRWNLRPVSSRPTWRQGTDRRRSTTQTALDLLI